MNNRWSYTLGVPSVYAAGRRLNAAQHPPSRSCVAARAPHRAFRVYVQETLVVDLPRIRSDRLPVPATHTRRSNTNSCTNSCTNSWNLRIADRNEEQFLVNGKGFANHQTHQSTRNG